MNIEILTSWPDVENLASEWNALLDCSRPESLFLKWEWIEAWRKARHAEVEPFVLVCRNDAGLVAGIAPFYFARLKALSVIPVRVLRLLGDESSGQEYQDWVISAKEELEVVDALVGSLDEHRDLWDLIWMPRVAGWNNASGRLVSASIMEKFSHRSRLKEFACVRLPKSMDDYEASLPSRRRQSIRRNSRKIAAIADLQYVLCESEAQLGVFLEALFSLHQARWEAVGRDGCFRRKPEEERFYREFAPVALAGGWLLAVGAIHKGEFVAIQFGYVFGGTYFQLQEGFDPNFEDGVGNALRHFSIGLCIERGIAEYDFLGGWTEHKRRWGSERRLGMEILIGSDSIVAKTIMKVNTWPKGRLLGARN